MVFSKHLGGPRGRQQNQDFSRLQRLPRDSKTSSSNLFRLFYVMSDASRAVLALTVESTTVWAIAIPACVDAGMCLYS